MGLTSLTLLSKFLISKISGWIAIVIFKFLLKFLGETRSTIIGFMLDWGYIRFPKAAEMMDGITDTYINASSSMGKISSEISREAYIEHNLIRAIQQRKLQVFMKVGSKKSMMLKLEIAELGLDRNGYAELLIKKSDLYRYLFKEFKQTKAHKRILEKIFKLEGSGSKPSRKYDELKDEADAIGEKITSYVHKE